MPEMSGSRLTAMMRGLRYRCPKCGTGALFRAYLKPVAHCAACGEPLGQIRADDFPPYLTILVVGHLVVPGILVAERAGWSSALQLAVWLPATVAMTLLLLPRFKGAIIGLMWSLGMGGEEMQAPTPPQSRPTG